ncbi:hypothetical protein H5410_043891 [Solanum commersonii]|uniref:Uncharacterized protein n=1 Tax=Solanum commersonii TaxID=4109 RepID=A0A9J5XYV8_SOLCO|nr:hypothetical protein H5410_043891 [Solanum commersonii]
MAGWSDLLQDLLRLIAHYFVTCTVQVGFTRGFTSWRDFGFVVDFRYSGGVMMFKRKVSLFHLVDDSLVAVEKANGSLNGGNMMPSIDKWYKKPYFRDSMRFCRRIRLFLYGIKKRSSQADEYPITDHAVSITGYCQQVTPIISPSLTLSISISSQPCSRQFRLLSAYILES